MNTQSKSNKLAGASVFSAIAASLCCITPILALIAGSTGAASVFSWIEPFRPYLIGITVIILGFAWYQMLKSKTANVDCECDNEDKKPFLQTKMFLSIVTVFASLMLAFPYYSKVFYPDNKKEVIVVRASDIETLNFDVKGMTCVSCEEHVKHAVNELDGIVNVNASFEKENTVVKYDKTKISKEDIEKAINSTGYKVIK